MQIEFLDIFDKFQKIPLMEAVEGGRPTTVDGGKGGWLWMVIGVF